MSLIQTARDVDLSHANISYVGGNQYNIYNTAPISNRALDVRGILLLAMPSVLTSFKEHATRLRGAADGRLQVRLHHNRSWSRYWST
jgi:hypothetical protein